MPITTTCITDSETVNLSVSNAGTLSGVVVLDPAPDNLASITEDGILVTGSGSTVPVGAILPFGGTAVPSGYLACDGAAVARTTYSALFAVVGTSFGPGDGSSTFNVPDMIGRSPAGYAHPGLAAHSDVTVMGGNEGATVVNRRPHHHHTLNDPQHHHTVPARSGNAEEHPEAILSASGSPEESVATTMETTGITVGVAAATSPIDTSAYLVTNMIIKAV